MNPSQPEALRQRLADKGQLQRIVAEQFRAIGIAPDPEATAERAQARILACGVCPGDNLFSGDLITSRRNE